MPKPTASREAEIAARLDAAERQIEGPLYDVLVEDGRYLLAQLQQARQERDAARAALEKYGQHDLRCDAHPPSHFDMARPRPCTCGLDAALKAVR